MGLLASAKRVSALHSSYDNQKGLLYEIGGDLNTETISVQIDGLLETLKRQIIDLQQTDEDHSEEIKRIQNQIMQAQYLQHQLYGRQSTLKDEFENLQFNFSPDSLTGNEQYDYDLFMSHASEDKRTLVSELANLLSKTYGLSVWMDELQITTSNRSASRSMIKSIIDKGMEDARIGLVVLSKHYISKVWTRYEFNSFLSTGTRLILIWYDITEEDIRCFDPFLLQYESINASLYSVSDLAEIIAYEVYHLKKRETIMRIDARERMKQARFLTQNL